MQMKVKKAANNSALLCSMDDEKIYGKDFHVLGFAESVSMGLLSDYKVVVLAVDEGYVSRTLQNLLTSVDSELKLDDSVKILGCLNGLSKKHCLKVKKIILKMIRLNETSSSFL